MTAAISSEHRRETQQDIDGDGRDGRQTVSGDGVDGRRTVSGDGTESVDGGGDKQGQSTRAETVEDGRSGRVGRKFNSLSSFRQETELKQHDGRSDG